jgi:hypothetical protein
MTGWLRQFVPFYASLAEPLQNCKTQLLSAGREQGKVQPNAIKKRKTFTTRTSWEPTATELQSFEATQAYLSDPKYLSHFYPEKLLFVKLDASHERGFGIMLFHLKDDTKVPTNLS